MKKNKIKLIFCLFLIAFIGIFFFIDKTKAQTNEKDPTIFTPQITIPGSEFQKGADVEIEDSTRTIGIYIKSIYNYLLAIVGLLATIVLMVSGIVWMTAAGNTERISQAKGWIAGSLTGLVLMLFSYVLLKTINPNLVNFRSSTIQELEKIEKGCCKLTNYKDVTGMFTGSQNTSMTMTTSALSCYYAAIELNEPGVKKIEELSKEEKDDIQGYLVKIGKFSPNYLSVGFTGCKLSGACLSQYTTGNIQCLPTFSSNCTGNTNVFIPNINCKQPDSVYIEIMKNNNTLNMPIELIEKGRILRATCPGDGEKCRSHDNTKTDDYCYDGICWGETGKLGEPCGNDGGLCVPSGQYDCSEFPGLKGRERGSGGRDCESGVKCCY